MAKLSGFARSLGRYPVTKKWQGQRLSKNEFGIDAGAKLGRGRSSAVLAQRHQGEGHARSGLPAGMGFTLSLFIAGLALAGELLAVGKIGTLTGSVVSAVRGRLFLLVFLPRAAPGTGHAALDRDDA